jgi:hypothetical protein
MNSSSRFSALDHPVLFKGFGVNFVYSIGVVKYGIAELRLAGL